MDEELFGRFRKCAVDVLSVPEDKVALAWASMPVGWRACGYLWLAHSEPVLERLRAGVELQNRLGIPSRIVSAAEAASLVPGHGGLLDRLDSLYFVVPVAAGLLRLLGLA